MPEDLQKLADTTAVLALLLARPAQGNSYADRRLIDTAVLSALIAIHKHLVDQAIVHPDP